MDISNLKSEIIKSISNIDDYKTLTEVMDYLTDQILSDHSNSNIISAEQKEELYKISNSIVNGAKTLSNAEVLDRYAERLKH